MWWLVDVFRVSIAFDPFRVYVSVTEFYHRIDAMDIFHTPGAFSFLRRSILFDYIFAIELT